MSEDMFAGVLTGVFPEGMFNKGVHILVNTKYLKFESRGKYFTVYTILKDFVVVEEPYYKGDLLRIICGG